MFLGDEQILLIYRNETRALVTQILRDKWSLKGVEFVILKSIKVYGHWRLSVVKNYCLKRTRFNTGLKRKRGRSFPFLIFFSPKNANVNGIWKQICWETCSFTRYVMFYCQGESGIRKLIWTRIFCKCNIKKILWNGSWKTKNNWKRKAPTWSRGIYVFKTIERVLIAFALPVNYTLPQPPTTIFNNFIYFYLQVYQKCKLSFTTTNYKP